jgi:hypothetical protein
MRTGMIGKTIFDIVIGFKERFTSAALELQTEGFWAEAIAVEALRVRETRSD